MHTFMINRGFILFNIRCARHASPLVAICGQRRHHCRLTTKMLGGKDTTACRTVGRAGCPGTAGGGSPGGYTAQRAWEVGGAKGAAELAGAQEAAERSDCARRARGTTRPEPP
jgi:hypothetical protein